MILITFKEEFLSQIKQNNILHKSQSDTNYYKNENIDIFLMTTLLQNKTVDLLI